MPSTVYCLVEKFDFEQNAHALNSSLGNIDHVFSQLYGYLSVVGTSVLLAHSIEAVAAENKHLLCSPVDFQCFYQHRSQQGSKEHRAWHQLSTKRMKGYIKMIGKPVTIILLVQS